MKILVIRGKGSERVKELIEMASPHHAQRLDSDPKLDEEIRKILKRLFHGKEESGEDTEDEVPTIH